MSRTIQDVFAPDGLLATSIPGYRLRPQQLEMAERIAAAIADNSVLVAEAGTGTGKTYVYIRSIYELNRRYGGSSKKAIMVAYLDAIIDAALRYADLNSSGRQNDPTFSVSQTAAASLYEMSPRHEGVQNRVQQRLKGLSGPRAETLRTILRK